MLSTFVCVFFESKSDTGLLLGSLGASTVSNGGVFI